MLVLCMLGAVVVVLGLPARGWGQASATVAGFVENETGTLVPDVTLILLPADAGNSHETSSDILGGFSFRNVAPGPYMLEARAQGYEPTKIAISLGMESRVGLKITVRRDQTASRTSVNAPVVRPSSGRTDLAKRTAQPLLPGAESAGPEPPPLPEISRTDDVQPDPGSDESDTNTGPEVDKTPEVQRPGAPGTQGPPPEPEPGSITRLPRLWSVGFGISNSYDTNIDHDQRNVGAYGLSYGTSVFYQSDRVRPLFQVGYDLTRYSVPGADRWTRLSHHLRATLERRLNRRIYFDTIGDFLTGTTSEDRELVNQYLVRPRLEFRLPRDHRLRLYTAYRLKRYANVEERNATNVYGGFELQRRPESGDRWLIGYRYEENRATGPRYRYRRLTYETEYVTVLTTQDTLTFNVVFRSQLYPLRFAEVDDIDVPRHNQRWTPLVSWAHRLGPYVEARLDYVFETQASNDLDESYTAHNLGFSFGFRW